MSACGERLWPGYAPRRARESVLRRVVAVAWPAFVDKAEGKGGLPGFVTKEFEAYLTCGLLEHGYARCLCARCGFEHAVPFRCKRRGFCPSCLGRRMNDLAIHLVDAVVPPVPLRQWVCTLPWALRYRVGFDKRACALFVRTFVGEVFRDLKRRAKRELGLRSVTEAHPGAVTFVQRADSALRLNPHLHVVVADGVFVTRGDGVTFEPVAAPSPDALVHIAERTARTVTEALTEDVSGDFDPLADEEPLLAHCYQRATSGRALRVLDGEPGPCRVPPSTRPLAASVDGFGVHAATTVGAHDAEERFRLLRYLARPPLSEERLTVRDDGRCVIGFHRRWADGTRAVVLSPTELMERLSALVPPPRFHLLRYHGVFSAHHHLRGDVVPGPERDAGSPQMTLPGLAEGATGRPVPTPDPGTRPKSSRTPWAKLLARVFLVDTSICPRCGGPSRIVDFVTDPSSAELPQTARAPPVPRHAVPMTLPMQLALPL